ncbi:MAG: hypothetical protein ABI779_23220 [Acidobacteriota bacterium]
MAVILVLALLIAGAIVGGVNAKKRRKRRASPASFVCAECCSWTYGDATPGFGLRFVVSVLVAAGLWLLMPAPSAAFLTLALIALAVLLNETAVYFGPRLCEHCRSRRVVPVNTPRGREIAVEYLGVRHDQIPEAAG